MSHIHQSTGGFFVNGGNGCWESRNCKSCWRTAMRGSRALLSDAGAIGKALSEFLVCPLTKQPLRQCPETGCLVSDGIGVSFPVVDDIPCLVPKDGNLLEDAYKATDPSNATDGISG